MSTRHKNLFFSVVFLSLMAITALILLSCKKMPINSNEEVLWKEFVNSGEEFSPGNYPTLGFGPWRTLPCDKVTGSHILLSKPFAIGISKPSGPEADLDHRYLVQIKAKSGDFEEAIATSAGLIQDLFYHFSTPEIAVIKGPFKISNGILESNAVNDSVAVRVKIDSEKYRIALGPILEDCE